MKESEIYVDKRIYAMKLRDGMEYSSETLQCPVNIRNFKPIAREMTSELDFGDYEDPDMTVVEFFTSTDCGCDHKIVPGDAFLMPEGSIFMVVELDHVINERRIMKIMMRSDNMPQFVDFPGDSDLCLMVYSCPAQDIIKWASSCYPRILSQRT